jgi:hypothetical protein
MGSGWASGRQRVRHGATWRAIWHDPATWSAIQDSGGIDDALWGVPVMLVTVGSIVGTSARPSVEWPR